MKNTSIISHYKLSCPEFLSYAFFLPQYVPKNKSKNVKLNQDLFLLGLEFEFIKISFAFEKIFIVEIVEMA